MLGVGRVVGATITIGASAAAGVGAAALGYGAIEILAAGGITGGITQLLGAVKDIKGGLRCISTLALGIMAGAGSAATAVALVPESSMEKISEVLQPIKKVIDKHTATITTHEEMCAYVEAQNPGFIVTI